MSIKILVDKNYPLDVIGASASEASDAIDVSGAKSIAVQSNVDVLDVDWDSAITATKEIQDLTLAAKNPAYAGALGNAISVEYLDPGTYDSALAVSVATAAISVSLESDHGTESSLVDQSLTYTAVEPGVAGDDISVELLDPGAPLASLDVTVAGDKISVSLATDAAVKSSLVDQGNTYTAQVAGVAGDLISIALIDPATAGATLGCTVASKDITVNLATDAEIKSTLVNQGLTYTALGVGVAGDAVSVELVDPAGEGEALDVTVAASAITVSLATRAEADATLVNQSLTYTSITADKEDGNDITIEYENPGVAGASLAVANVAEVITVTLATLANTYASKVIQDLTYTAAAAQLGHGDTISIEYTGDGTAGAETFTVVGHHVEVHMDDTPVTGSTATQIRTAWNLNAPAAALASCAGTSATVQNDTAVIFLEGEVVGGAITSTGNAVKAAVNAAVGAGEAGTYVLVSGTQAGVVTAFGPTNLAGGENGGEITSTANDIKTAVNADIEANLLVTVSGSGATPVVVMGHTHLAGGYDGKVITSTGAAIVAKIIATPAAIALISVSGAGVIPVTAKAKTSLAGGYDGGVITSTGNAVKAAVNIDPQASLLVLVSGTNAGVVTALAEAHLASGADYELVSTATEVKNAIDADDPGAADLVDVTVTGSGSTKQVAVGHTHLAGGLASELFIATSKIYIPAHGLVTGTKVEALSETGTLPDPLADDTEYWVIKVNANYIQLAESLADAEAGTFIVFTDDGTPDTTFDLYASLDTGKVGLEVSNDGVTWVDAATPTAVTVDTSIVLSIADPVSKWVRVVGTCTDGGMRLQNYVVVKGESL